MRRFFFVALAFILSSCASLGVPQATPTVAPTRTATPTMARTLQAQLATRTPFPTATDTEAPELTVVSSSTPTLTITPSLTHTATATASATRTATRTQTNAPTATFTHTPTYTPTPTATDTPTQTLTATVTLLPLLRPTDTPSATFTPTPSPSHTATFTHTFTPVPPTAQPSRTPDQTATAQAQATDTAPPTRTLAPTFTALPQPTATRTIAPTIDAPPTFITAEAQTAIPEDIALSLTPIAVDSTASIDAPTSTPSPAPTVANVNPPPTISIADLPRFDPLPQARVFALGSGGQTSAFSLNISNPTLFAQNPADPNTFLATDAVGLLYTVNNGQVSRFTGSPFSGFETSREDNNAVVIDAAWSPNGAYIAFVVDSDRTENDGVWWYQPGANPPLQLLVDCSPEQECLTVQRNDPPYEYETRSLVWSPQNDAVLAQVYMYDYGRYGQTVLPATRDESIRNVRRPVFQYDSGDWSVDGSRIIVSGRTGDGRVILGSINREGGDERVVLDGGASGLWIQDGVQAPSGELLALGRAGDANGPMQIIDQQGNTLTPPIGGAPVVRAKWNPERTQVYVETQDGRKYVATTSGEIQDLTDFIGGIRAVSWMGGRLPAEGGANNVPPDYVPAGVIEGARFAPGQQLRVASNTGQLNLRATPQLDGAIVGNALNGEYVAILAGPRLFDGVEWWQVQLAGGQTGWMAGAINNVPVLVP